MGCLVKVDATGATDAPTEALDLQRALDLNPQSENFMLTYKKQEGHLVEGTGELFLQLSSPPSG